MRYDAADRIRFECAGSGWLQSIPSETYDGFFCSNILDVIPTETAEEIIREAARILRPDGSMIVGLNYYLSQEAAAKRGMELAEGNLLYVDGVLSGSCPGQTRNGRIFSQAGSPWNGWSIFPGREKRRN